MSSMDPALRIADVCRIEIGDEVLLVGMDPGGVAGQLVRLCGEAGALATRCIGANDVALGRFRPDADVVICLEQPAGGLGPVLAACRDRGTVIVACRSSTMADVAFYPDAHKRGLHLRFVSPAEPVSSGDPSVR